jgi:ketosteroid isomerase-like protein
MGAEQNKELVTKTWQAFARGDVDATLNNIANDVSWTVPGNLPHISGVKQGKDAIVAFMKGLSRAFPEGLKTEIRKIYADADTVILELTNRGKVANGKFYENEYCFVFEVGGGKIRRIREYVDTQRVKDVMSG